MRKGTMELVISKRINGDFQVYAYDINIDGEVYHEVSRDKAFNLVIQAQEVADEMNYFLNVRGMHYLRNDGTVR